MSKLAWHSPADLLGGLAAVIGVGKVLRTGESSHPHYELVAFGEGKAWIRDIQSGTDHFLPTARRRQV